MQAKKDLLSWMHETHVNPATLNIGETERDESYKKAATLLTDQIKAAFGLTFFALSNVADLLEAINETNRRIARETKSNLRVHFGYCESCAEQALLWFVSHH